MPAFSDHIGGIKPPPEADLQQQDVGRMPREQEETRRGGDLEHRDGGAPIGALAFGQRIAELDVGRQTPCPDGAETEPFVETHEVRRGVDVHAISGSFQDAAHERDRRALAVGTGHVEHRRQALFWMVERRENAPHALERKIDPLGMQRQEPCDDGVDLIHVK